MDELPPSTDQELLADFPEPIFLVFSAPWCGVCPGFKSTVRELAPQFSGQAKFYTVNADQNTDLANYCGVSSLPSLVLLNRSEVMAVHRGNGTRKQISEWIETLLS